MFDARRVALRRALVAGIASTAALLGCGSSDEGPAGGDAGTAGTSAGGAAGSSGTAGSSGDAGAGGLGRTPCVPDSSAPPTPRDVYDSWVKVELPGTVCGDGSQYKFFVSYTDRSNDVLVMFEPGGACWDYDSCTGSNGIRGAANPNGIPDSHMTRWGLAYPFYHRADPDNPFRDFNLVFVPYCTGDVHSGNNVITYQSADGAESVEFHHAGHTNVLAVAEWLGDEFSVVPRLAAGGCSAGGAGSLLNYYFLRTRIRGSQCGYLIDDAGPIFPSTGNSAKLHAKIRDSWATDVVLDDIEAELGTEKVEPLRTDYGLINTLLADRFPSDRLTITYFRLDLNYSVYSYERFFDQPTHDEILRLWWEDTQLLTALYDTRDNLGYFIPYFRRDNCSHCASIVPVDHILEVIAGSKSPYFGTEIQEAGLDLRGYARHVLDDATPLESHLESEQPGEGFTPSDGASCL